MVFSYKKFLVLTILCLSAFAIRSAFAQSLETASVPDDLANDGGIYETGPSESDIVLDMTPNNPGAFQTVTLRTTSDYIDLNRYSASWFVNGKKVGEGIGKRSVTVQTGAYGQRTSVIILIQLPGTLIKKNVSFEPQDMTLLWEAVDAYVPPFYEGKKLLSREGIAKVVALPNFKDAQGSYFDPGTGVYRWNRNGNVVGEATGYGKDSFSFKNNKVRAVEEVTVTASDTEATHESTQSIRVPTTSPKILFYGINASTGITSGKPLSSIDLAGDASTVIAEPYFFSVRRSNPAELSFGWTMNGEPITLSDKKNPQTVTLQNPGGSGSAVLGLSIQNPNTLFQEAASRLSLIINPK